MLFPEAGGELGAEAPGIALAEEEILRIWSWSAHLLNHPQVGPER